MQHIMMQHTCICVTVNYPTTVQDSSQIAATHSSSTLNRESDAELSVVLTVHLREKEKEIRIYIETPADLGLAPTREEKRKRKENLI